MLMTKLQEVQTILKPGNGAGWEAVWRWLLEPAPEQSGLQISKIKTTDDKLAGTDVGGHTERTSDKEADSC